MKLSMIKKSAALFLGFILMLTCLQITAEEFYTETDTIGFDTAVGLFRAIGVLEADDEAEMATTVTKGMFLQTALRLFGGGADGFADNEYKNYVGLLGADTEEVTQNEGNMLTHEYAVRAMIFGLGYDLVTDEMGGYQITAQRIGLLKGIEYRENQYMTFAQVIRLFENALPITLVRTVTDGKRVNTLSGKATLLSDVFRLEKRRGVVTATERTPLLGEEELPKGQIQVGGIVYNTNLDYTEFLGMSVEFYVRDVQGDEELIFLYTKENQNKILNLTDAELTGYVTGEYSYETSGKTKTAKIASPFYVVYNGFAAGDLQQTDMMPAFGSVTLIDNNGDGEYDVVNITDYTVGRVRFAQPWAQALYIETAKGAVTISLEDYDSYEITNRGGGPVVLSGLKEGDIVLATPSREKHFIRIERVNSMITGKAEQIIMQDNLIDKVVVNGQEFRLVSGSIGTAVVLSKAYSFYTDNGCVVAVSEPMKDDSVRYAYLIKAALRETAFEKVLKVKLFNENAQMQTLDAASKVKIDEVRCKDGEEALRRLTGDDGSFHPQLVRYSQNSDGEISMIDTAYNYTSDYKTKQPENGESTESFRVLYSAMLANEGSVRYEETGTFGGKFILGSPFKLFQVPSNIETAEDSDYMVMNSMSYINTTDSYSVEAFSSGKSNLYADAAVFFGSGATRSGRYEGVITSICTEVDEDGQAVEKISISGPPGVAMDFYNYDFTGTIPPYWDDRPTAPRYDYEVGDIVSCAFRGSKVTLLCMIYDRSADHLVPCPAGRGYGGWHYYIMGNAYEKEGSAISVTTADLSQPDLSGITKEIYNTASFSIRHVVERKNGQRMVLPAGVNDIIDYKSDPGGYSRCFVYTSEGFPWLIVIYDD